MLGVWLSTNVLSCLMRTTCSSRRLMNSFSVGNFVLPLSTLAFSTLVFLYWRHVNFTILNDLLHFIVVGLIQTEKALSFFVSSVYTMDGWKWSSATAVVWISVSYVGKMKLWLSPNVHAVPALQPSNETFSTMMHDIQMKKENKDGADQGFITNHFSDLLDRPMFHPPANGSRLSGLFRLPLGYQMDASYFCKSSPPEKACCNLFRDNDV